MQSPLSKNILETLVDTKDYLLTGESFSLYYDKEWEMLITHPLPDDLSKYYESKDYKPHQHRSKSLFDKMYNYIRKRGYRYKLQLIKNFHTQAKSVLDYGTATGEFLQFMSKNDFAVSGIEPNEIARKVANQNLDNKVKVSIDNISEKFDVITLWHVLEHLPDLDAIIEKLKQHLLPGGIIVLAVPNFQSYDAKFYKKHWAAYDVPRHLWHFSPKAINKLFSRHKMTVIGQKPLYFDSFYVSLLSEQYKTGKKWIVSAFYRGLISNIKARKTGQYSSLIYIIRGIEENPAKLFFVRGNTPQIARICMCFPL